jgi:hypothetical protein
MARPRAGAARRDRRRCPVSQAPFRARPLEWALELLLQHDIVEISVRRTRTGPGEAPGEVPGEVFGRRRPTSWLCDARQRTTTVISSAIDGTPQAGLEWRHGGSPAATSLVTPGAAATNAGCAAVAPGAGTSTAGFAMFTLHSYPAPSWSVSVWPTDSVTTDPLSASVTVVAGAALATVVGPGVASGATDGGGVRRTGTGVPAGPSDGLAAFGVAAALGGATVIPMVAAPPDALGIASGTPEVPGTAVPAGPAPDAADAASGRAVPGAPRPRRSPRSGRDRSPWARPEPRVPAIVGAPPATRPGRWRSPPARTRPRERRGSAACAPVQGGRSAVPGPATREASRGGAPPGRSSASTPSTCGMCRPAGCAGGLVLNQGRPGPAEPCAGRQVCRTAVR